jgi:hypothetical protein
MPLPVDVDDSSNRIGQFEDIYLQQGRIVPNNNWKINEPERQAIQMKMVGKKSLRAKRTGQIKNRKQNMHHRVHATSCTRQSTASKCAPHQYPPHASAAPTHCVSARIHRPRSRWPLSGFRFLRSLANLMHFASARGPSQRRLRYWEKCRFAIAVSKCHRPMVKRWK